MFRGVAQLNLDSKGRLAVPSRFRDALTERCSGHLVITADSDRCLLIYPLPDWEPIEQKLMALSSFNTQIRELQRRLVGYAEDAVMDATGRILVPPALRGAVGPAVVVPDVVLYAPLPASPASDTFDVTLSTQHGGKLSAKALNGNTAIVAGSDSTALHISGTRGAVELALQTLTYEAADGQPSDTITVTAAYGALSGTPMDIAVDNDAVAGVFVWNHGSGSFGTPGNWTVGTTPPGGANAALFGAAMILVSLAVYGAISANAERTVRDELTATGAVFDQVWDLRSGRLQDGAGLLARDFGFRSAVASRDQGTIVSALDNLKARLNVDIAFMVDIDGVPTGGDAALLARVDVGTGGHQQARDLVVRAGQGGV